MSVRAFLNAAYAMLVVDWQGLGLDVFSAMAKVDESIGLAVAGPQPAVVGVPTAADNDRALAELQAQLKRVKR